MIAVETTTRIQDIGPGLAAVLTLLITSAAACVGSVISAYFSWKSHGAVNSTASKLADEARERERRMIDLEKQVARFEGRTGRVKEN